MCVHVTVNACLDLCEYMCLCVYVHVYMWLSECVCVCTQVYVCVHECMCVHMYLCVYTYVCVVHVGVYVYVHALFIGMLLFHAQEDLFPSQLQLTMRRPFLLKSPLCPLRVRFLVLLLFHCCPFGTNFWQHIISLGDLYISQEECTSNSTIDHHIWHLPASWDSSLLLPPSDYQLDTNKAHYTNIVVHSLFFMLCCTVHALRGLWCVLLFCSSSSNTPFGFGTTITVRYFNSVTIWTTWTCINWSYVQTTDCTDDISMFCVAWTHFELFLEGLYPKMKI